MAIVQIDCLDSESLEALLASGFDVFRVVSDGPGAVRTPDIAEFGGQEYLGRKSGVRRKIIGDDLI